MDYCGGGGQRVCWPPSQIIGGGGLAPLGPPPSSYAYVIANVLETIPEYLALKVAIIAQ